MALRYQFEAQLKVECLCLRFSQMTQLVQIVVVVSLALLLGTSDATLVRAIAALRGEATCTQSGEACERLDECCSGPCTSAGWTSKCP